MKKSLIFLYGILSYVVFLASFLYAVGFVGELLVPKDINSGATSGMMESIVINLLLLSVFAVQHSIMARPAFKKRWTKIIDPAMERSTFVLLTSLILFLIFWQWRPMTDVIWNIEGESFVLIIEIFFWLGWVIVLLSTFMINHFHLFGLDQVWNRL
ncbi:MAG: isoprenylcysteine carboxylmethyltransferase family protein, partial [Bacteroidia bacterium]|nr:isoprenylcysteine carboxylmethyltransferase family protein [Bacteroidia bacterium]